ncbi:MAG: dienelactone hydrolase family protein [Chitinophagaceae bacterium]|nr:dienelactone hydrolase family protein [Chitinophagaceae bacterium]
MKLYKSACAFFFASVFFLHSCNEQPETEQNKAGEKKEGFSIKEETVNFSMDSVTSTSYVVYDENKTGIRPVVLVLPEWWGLVDYPKSRARQLAELGYLAMAVDIIGNGKTADNPEAAGTMTMPFYADAQMTLRRLNAAIAKIKTMPQADTSKVAAIGYCFGGGILLNTSRIGLDVDGVVSFHGSLNGTPVNKDLLKAKILVCHGAADSFVPEQDVVAFRKSMDSINANYVFKSYPYATHAFTNPAATETGKKFNLPIAYNAAADTASWNDMKVFFDNLFTSK